MALIPRHLFQGVQRRAGLLFVLTVFEDVPDTTQEGAQATDLLIGLDDLDQALFFLGTHSLFGLEQHVSRGQVLLLVRRWALVEIFPLNFRNIQNILTAR